MRHENHFLVHTFRIFGETEW